MRAPRTALPVLILALAGCSPGGSGAEAQAPAAPPAQAAPAAAQRAGLTFVFPVACETGRTCEVQNYVDRDPGPGVKDYRCASRSYADHGGVDIRLPDLAAQKAGVDVLAAAAGQVLRVRDGVPDVSVAQTGVASVEGINCGNGVVIGHAEGVETQYCHMAQGSVRVKPGQTVAAGEPIGRIGLSGQTEYPHLHFTVRKGGQVVDPFAPDGGEGCEARAPMWDAAALKQLAYKPGAVLNAGFTTGPVQMAALEQRALPAASADAPALVAYVRAISLDAGDVQELSLLAPDGSTLAVNRAEPLQRPRAQHMLFVGKRRPPAGWPPGTYRARYVVLRQGRPALERSFEIKL